MGFFRRGREHKYHIFNLHFIVFLLQHTMLQSWIVNVYFTFTYLGNCVQELGTPLYRSPHHSHTWQGRLGRGSADTGYRAAEGSWEERLLPGHFGTPQPDLPSAPGLDRPALPAYQGPLSCRCQAEDRGMHGGALFSDHRLILLPFVLQLLLLRWLWPQQAPW